MEREEDEQAEEKVWLATNLGEREGGGHIDGFSAERGAKMGTEVGLVLPGFFGNLQLEESPPLGFSLSSDHTDTWALSILSSSSSSLPCLSPPLPPSVGLDGVLAEGRLVLDVYRGGGEVLPVFWECVQERMRGLQYLRLGSEDEGALEKALSVLPRLTQLRSLAIRGHRFYDPQGDPLPGLLSSLPDSVSSLSLLVHLDLSFNCLSFLPPCLLSLSHLSELLLCHNQLTGLPEGLGALVSLRRVSLLGNRLEDLPRGVGLLCRLEELDVSFNQLERLPEELGQLQDLQKLELSNNRLRALPETLGSLRSLRQLVIQSNDLRTVPECLRSLPLLDKLDTRNNPLGRPPTPPLIAHVTPVLEESEIPELHLGFGQHSFEVSSAGCHVFIPGGAELLFPRRCVKAVTQLQWAERRPDRKWVWLEEHDVLLSRQLELRPHGATFEEVLQVVLSEVQDLTGDPHASASPLLCLSQTPSIHFLQPITVQIPLPAGVTGHMVDMSRLHLMHGDPTAHTWTDITAQVSLYVTHIYAVFSITHFSWYWLWYTTHRCVSGVVRKMYHRLKQFRIRFLALQKKNDPEQVLLQCLPSDKAESRLASLSEQYEGPQPSELCILLEGEQFFAGFERGIDISADRPDCKDGRLSFTFYSHLKNIKEVHVCPTHPQQGTVRGQVSFYRGEVPNDLPEEVASKRKGHDNQWMATLPLRIANADCDGSISGELNLGDPESGYLTQTNLLSISLRINQEWQNIGINLGISYDQLERIRNQHRDNFGAQVLAMLFHWARGQQGAGPGAVQQLMKALVNSGRRDLAEEVEDIVTLGKRKYEESLKRVGLQTPASSADPQSS
ncbi:p53-induced death domain-containing protein 1 isoform X2 [Sinocyclocheilus grahami]|uniref:p53-induced death domain-containing protein 1 isoform X2 n=1 Tax=Sinocyclocheilus grahami TaxID=75366 RepID=UPI0007AD303B|nr:PREDICTED: p53-induced death domain-containing protein 1-like isoform X2 [Sinocyclocheilus grahami]